MNQVQIVRKTIYVSPYANALRKGMNLSPLPGLLSFLKRIGLREGKTLNSKPEEYCAENL